MSKRINSFSALPLIALFTLSSCAGLLPATYDGPRLQLIPPAGITQVENEQNTNYCRARAAGSIPVATRCMQKLGYKLTEVATQ